MDKQKFLKSHLQKCVRRHENKLAVRSSLELIKIDQNDFIRRLPIIMIEDSNIFSTLPSIIWFMVAISKGYKLTDMDVKWLLGCVRNISKCKSKLNYNNLKEPALLESNNNIFNNCILLRINYGGMKGDMTMLRKTISIIEGYKVINRKLSYKNLKN